MILSVLKIIGSILLILLALVLALILLILFVPVRYRGNVLSSGGHTNATVCVTWLLRLIRFELLLDTENETKTLTDLYIFGISLKKLKASMAEKKKAKRKKAIKKKLKKLSDKDPEKYQELKEKALQKKKQKEMLQKGLTDDTSSDEIVLDDTTSCAAADQNTNNHENTLTPNTAAPLDHSLSATDEKRSSEASTNQGNAAKAEDKKTDAQKLWLLTRKLLTVCAGIILWLIEKLSCVFKKAGTFFGNIGRKLKSIACKIRYWQKLITDPDTWKAVSVVLIKSKKLIRHILPRHLSGNILFGTGDPYTTGTALAAAEAFYPLWCDKFEVTPDFDNKIIEGQADFKGRIFIFYTAYLLLTAYFNKSVKKTISYIRQE